MVGVVFGASFTDNYEVEHTNVNEVQKLNKLRTSKYVQSYQGNMYKKVKELLECGKTVLYTGTSCQIEGLYSFLQKDYDNLYTQDIICHGVPSFKVWGKYMKYRSNGETIKKINFRNKDLGWKDYSLLLKCGKGKDYNENHKNDIFMHAFLKGTILRSSCYDCHFKEKFRNSDITLGDYWGVLGKHPELNDNKGISLVIVNSTKGRKLFDSIKDEMIWKETDFEYAISKNPAYFKSAKMDENREEFFAHLDTMSFDKLVKKYTYQEPFLKKIITKIKRKVKR